MDDSATGPIAEKPVRLLLAEAAASVVLALSVGSDAMRECIVVGELQPVRFRIGW
jgi:hypothetical protein